MGCPIRVPQLFCSASFISLIKHLNQGQLGVTRIALERSLSNCAFCLWNIVCKISRIVFYNKHYSTPMKCVVQEGEELNFCLSELSNVTLVDLINNCNISGLISGLFI